MNYHSVKNGMPFLISNFKVDVPHQNYIFQERDIYLRGLDYETKCHVFTPYYKPPNVVASAPTTSPTDAARALLEGYRQEDAIEFMAMSHVWLHRNSSTEQLSSPTNAVEVVPQFATAEGIKAIYRVIMENETTYILLACHMNVHGLHRADLRFIEVNNRSKAQGCRHSIVGLLAVGDILLVSELARVRQDVEYPVETDIYTINELTPPFWMASKLTVINRVCFTGIPLTILPNRTAVVEHFSEVMTVKYDQYLREDALHKVYIGSGFVPVKVSSEFAEGSPYWNTLHTIAVNLKKYPNAMGIVLKYTVSEEYTAYFKCGTKAFAQNALDSIKVTELCATMGSNAVNAIQKGRFDSRSFKMISPRREGEIIRFSIRNPSDQPTFGLWRPNSRIIVGGAQKNVDAVIETVLTDKKLLNIVARLSRNHQYFRFTEETHMVAQREMQIPKGLPENFLRNLPEGSNGRRIIETFYGRQPRIENLTTPIVPFVYPSNPAIHLNPFQCTYVARLLSRTPLTVACAPFGCGKSVTIVTAAMRCGFQDRQTGNTACELLVTQSNFASVNLADILMKATSAALEFKAVRFLSERNWNEMADDCRTPLDYPAQLRQLCIQWVTARCSLPSTEVLEQFVTYLVDRQLFPLENMQPQAQKLYRRSGWRCNAAYLVTAFFKYYKPEIIVVTADSLPLLISELPNVRTIQFDEASQLPEATLLRIVAKFPNACYGLVGDTHQLPPYSDRELTGHLKDFGVGNAMERAVNEKLFPQAVLRVVYRCHPEITKLLGSMFYNSVLQSGVDRMDREYFQRSRPDIWSTPYPIQIIQNPAVSQKMGTSVGNLEEILIVEALVSQLINPPYGLMPIPPFTIGIISFYKAQASMLTERFRGSDIKCGTVDSFQGSEREVIIICTTNHFVSEFMSCRKRVNVAFSRARQSSIIVGNVDALKCAEYWQPIVNQARVHNAIMRFS